MKKLTKDNKLKFEDQAVWYFTIRYTNLTWAIDFRDASDFFNLWSNSLLFGIAYD